MLYIRINKKTNEFEGFSDKFDEIYENIEITGEEHKNYIESQNKGFSLYWNTKDNQLETIKLNQFDYIDENGTVTKNTAAELKYYKDLLLTLKKERIQLKKDIRDFEEFEEDTTDLKEQLQEKEKEIEDLENKIKKLEG